MGAKNQWIWSLLVAVVLTGCGGEQAAAPADGEGDVGETSADATATDAGQPSAEPEPEQPPPPPTIPEVKLTEAAMETCLVGVGDTFPSGELAGLDGEVTSLQSIYGSRLTVVCFWKSDNLYALAELQDLALDVVEPYGDKGVSVVGVNVGEEAELVAEKVKMTGAEFPILLDADGSFFEKVATAELPRTYLLDEQGKIIWFDIEYSQGTRRDLLQAIQVALGEL